MVKHGDRKAEVRTQRLMVSAKEVSHVYVCVCPTATTNTHAVWPVDHIAYNLPFVKTSAAYAASLVSSIQHPSLHHTAHTYIGIPPHIVPASQTEKWMPHNHAVLLLAAALSIVYKPQN